MLGSTMQWCEDIFRIQSAQASKEAKEKCRKKRKLVGNENIHNKNQEI